jgi:hypothetical protein
MVMVLMVKLMKALDAVIKNKGGNVWMRRMEKMDFCRESCQI